MQSIRSKCAFFLACIALPIYIVRTYWYTKFGTQLKRDKEMKRYGRDFLGVKGCKIEAFGQESLDPESNYIYVSNHQSHNDIFILIRAIKAPFRFVAKKELFDNPFTGAFMKFTQSYALEREDPRQSLIILKEALSDVNNNGKNIVVFPEGTRSHGAEMNAFKEGLFSILRRSTKPIVPVVIDNSYDESATVYRVYFGEPYIPESFNTMKGPELSKALQEKMNEMLHIEKL